MREIEVIRDTKKPLILEKLFDKEGAGSKKIYVTPGENAFFTHVLRNGTNMRMIYTIRITDADVTLYGIKPEMVLVTDNIELEHWVRKKKVVAPASYG